MTFQEFFNDLINPLDGTVVINETVFESLKWQLLREEIQPTIELLGGEVERLKKLLK